MEALVQAKVRDNNLHGHVEHEEKNRDRAEDEVEGDRIMEEAGREPRLIEGHAQSLEGLKKEGTEGVTTQETT